MKITLKEIELPELDKPKQSLLLDSTMKKRYEKIIALMEDYKYDYLLIYCDLEHGGNFEYLTGFVTRFEESLLILSKKKNYLIAGNENINKETISRCPVEGIHYAPFSLPNQPNEGGMSLKEIFENIGMSNQSIGLVGWKLINENKFDIPHWIVRDVESITNRVRNATNLFIDPEIGARVINDENELAYYEYGSSLASYGILKALYTLKEGISEVELGGILDNHGQRNNVVTIAATGKRFENARISPTNKEVQLGDAISLTVGYKGGLQSRAGYAVSKASDLHISNQDYLEKLCIPYYTALVKWLQTIHVGCSGDEIYKLIESVLPKSQYNWSLNPGHLCADEEWLSSPIYEGSKTKLKSGMILQYDIIPSMQGYAGVSCEGGICLADEQLRNKLRSKYPEKYKSFEQRKQYMSETLGINVSDDVLFMGNADMFYRPFLLSNKAFVIETSI